ncbi:MAG: TonB-dependent receptor [Bacteroidota bacterium]|nr:TonB-dependent receptor [Bacteroidota bacterium]
MRVPFFIATTLCLHMSAWAFKQNISLSVKKEPLRNVLSLIEKNSDYRFLYNENAVFDNRSVTIKVQNASLDEVMKHLLEGTNLSYKVNTNHLVDLSLHQSNEAKSVQQLITGKITDNEGKELEGVSVTVKGTNKGTSTNADGEFSIDANPGDVLEFSIVGYKTVSVTVGNQATVSVSMQVEASALTDVVVVAYGRQKRISVTGSVATVSGKQLRQSPATNLSNSLAGRLPGLVATQRSGEPGNDGASLQIRGVSTLGDNSPLVIVDGIPGRSLSQINPNDVESISILKDAAAAAYGARSANGVILVTTRRGSTGKTSFGYTGSYGWQIPTRLPEYVNSYDFARLYNQAAKNDNPNATPTYNDEAIQKYKDGSDRDRYPNTDWIKESIRPSAPQTQHTVTLRGGGKQARFFASAGYFNQEGIWYGNATNFKRYNFTSNVDFEINSNFTGSLDLQGRQENRNFPGIGASTIFSSMLRPGAIWPARYSNGLLAGGYNNAGTNPLLQSSNASGFTDDKNNVLQTKLILRHQLPFITKGLAVEGIFAYDKSYRHVKNWSTPYKYYSLNATTGVFQERTANGSSPFLGESYIDDRNSYGRITLDYLRDFGKHDISALALYEFEDYFYSSLSGLRRNFAVSLPYLNLGNIDQNLTNGGSSREYGRKSWFGRINYAYDDKYLLEMGLRADESANFPKDKRLGYFPAVSAGWVVTKMPWFKVNVISNLKLRASWSLRGNDILYAGDADNRIIRYEYLSLYNFNSSGYVLNGQAVATLSPGVVGNPNLTWEKAETYNIGFDAGLLSNKLALSVDAFVKKSRDILDLRILSVPAYTGISLPRENLSKVTTKGFEAEATWRSKIARINYFINANLAYAKSRIDFRDESPNVPSYQKVTGHPVGSGLYYISTGLFQSKDEIDKSPKQFGTLQPGDIKYKDINGDNVIDPKDRIVVDKTQNPWTTFGFSFGADWKGLDFSVLFQGALNSNLYLSNEAAWPFFNGGNLLQKWVDDSWTPDNSNASLPRLFLASSNNTQQSTFWLKNANYLRLKNIEIGYNVPTSLINKWSITGLRFYVNGLNLFTVDKIKTFDPEYPNGRGWNYPQQKVINLGLNVQF